MKKSLTIALTTAIVLSISIITLLTLYNIAKYIAVLAFILLVGAIIGIPIALAIKHYALKAWEEMKEVDKNENSS